MFLSRLKSTPNYQKQLRTQQSQGKKQYERLEREAREELMARMRKFRDGTIDFAEMRRDTADFFEHFYSRIFEAGRKASGLDLFVPDRAEPTKGEKEWLKTAIREELKFWQSFLKEIENGDTQFKSQMTPQELLLKPPRRRYTVEERLVMYLKGMEGIYENGRVSGMPNDVLFYWFGPKPGDRGICLTDSSCLVTSICGKIQLKDVVPGDLVLTHKGRWCTVTDKHVNPATPEHRYAVVVGSGFRLFGVTQDHRVWTDDGWLSAEDAARQKKDLLNFEVGVLPVPEEGREVYSDVLGRNEDASDPSVPVGVGEGLRPRTGGLCCSPQKREPAGRPVGELGDPFVHEAPSTPCGISALEGARQEAVENVPNLQDEVPGHASEIGSAPEKLFRHVPHKMDAEKEEAETLCCVREGHSRESIGGQNKEVLLSEVLSNIAPGGDHPDPAVRLLWRELQEEKRADQVIHEGQVLLLKGVLPEESPLFDLTVEGDSSFVVEGHAIHNCKGCEYIVERQPYPKGRLPAVPRSGATPCLMNCRHKLVVRKADPKTIAKRRRALPERTSMQKALQSMMESKWRYRTKGKLINPWER
jgi:hypothetical protein